MSKEINTETETVIRHVRETIQQWMQKEFSRQIGVSIQFSSSYQGKGRPSPINDFCDGIYNDERKRKICDISDQIMKYLAYKSGKSLAYCCHGGLSNIVIPHYETITRTEWYIFLGQFAIGAEMPCADCTTIRPHCRAYEKTLNKEKVYILDASSINSLPDDIKRLDAVRPSFFDFTVKGLHHDYVIDIHQLIMCKRKAVQVLSDEIQNSVSIGKIMDCCKDFANFPDLKEQISQMQAQQIAARNPFENG